MFWVLIHRKIFYTVFFENTENSLYKIPRCRFSLVINSKYSVLLFWELTFLVMDSFVINQEHEETSLVIDSNGYVMQ